MILLKIQQTSSLAILTILLFVGIVASVENPKTNSTIANNNVTIPTISSNVTSTSNKTNNQDVKTKPGGVRLALDTNAVLRGFYVFAGLTVVVLAYMVFRSRRLTRTRAQMVRKYGVLAHRQDVEMRPLPLDEEDDEDTTVFDASNAVRQNL